jgi:protein ImuB
MARAPRQPGLFEADALPPDDARPLRALSPSSVPAGRAARRLWLSLYFSELPLAALAGEADRPRAILGQDRRRSRVQFCNPAARHHGVRPGLPVNAALALAPDLELLPRDLQREQRLLSHLAILAIQFTPCVSFAGDATLLLEIGGSLRLFGPAEELRAQVLQVLDEQGHQCLSAIAPTARAAQWLAHARSDVVILDRTHLAGLLGGLRVASLSWPAARCRRLQEMGIDTLADCVRLPRDGLARRFGTELLRELDQAYGRYPEALDWYRPAQHFEERIELDQESRNTDQLIAVLEVLVERLAGQLRTRQCSVRRVWLCCAHRDQPDTRIRIGLLQATAEPSRLCELGRVQLAATRLPAVVQAVSLQAAFDTSLEPQSAGLLDSHAATAEDALAFVERLRARLGAEAVHGLQVCAEHRPERAWGVVRDPAITADNELPDARTTGQRPLWMLPVPLKLREVQGRPVFKGGLELSGYPERIETGWWDGGDIRRDYYVASNAYGMRLWVYRDLRETCWYLHGLFG